MPAWLLWAGHCIDDLGVPTKPKVRIQTLESLAYTLNHIFLEDRKIRTYELPDKDNTLMVAESEMAYGKRESKKT